MSYANPLDELEALRQEIDLGLGRLLSEYPDDVPVIREAMSYSLEGGKRLRGAILLSVFRNLGGIGDPLPFALAMEMIQAYSLVHDDLPCMDDDDTRRGKPTCHKKFGEAIGVLTGDALLTLAFETAASSDIPPDRVAMGIRVLGEGAGATGMVGGQVLDMQLEEAREIGSAAQESTSTYPDKSGRSSRYEPNSRLSRPDTIRWVYRLKTGRLFEASAKLGGILAGRPDMVDRISRWGSSFGYAYQLLDDLDDLIQGGKEDDKNTLVRSIGIQAAKKEAADSLRRSLDVVDPDWFLAKLSKYYLQTKLADVPNCCTP